MSTTTLTTADGLALHVRIEGNDDDPTVVLAHGLAGSVALSWASFGVIDAELGGAPVVRVPGDHITAPGSAELAEAVVAVVRDAS